MENNCTGRKAPQAAASETIDVFDAICDGGGGGGDVSAAAMCGNAFG